MRQALLPVRIGQIGIDVEDTGHTLPKGLLSPPTVCCDAQDNTGAQLDGVPVPVLLGTKLQLGF